MNSPQSVLTSTWHSKLVVVDEILYVEEISKVFACNFHVPVYIMEKLTVLWLLICFATNNVVARVKFNLLAGMGNAL